MASQILSSSGHHLSGIICILVLLRFLGSCTGASDWSYHGETGPNKWKNIDANCGKNSQSPIDLIANKAALVDIKEIKFNGYSELKNASSDLYTLVNNGHTVQLNINSGISMNITDGGLTESYTLAQFHMHWGDTNRYGSEHTVDGKSYPMEIHFVHFKTSHSNISASLSDKEGLAVLGVFVEIGEHRHAAWDAIISRLCSVKYSGDKYSDIKSFRMSDLLPQGTKEFFRYGGSLTTPPCSESVIWTVFRNPIQISQTQMNAFRAVSHAKETEANLDDEPIVDNYRPVQKLGSRSPTRTFAVPDKPPSKAKSEANGCHFGRGTAAAAAAFFLFGRLMTAKFSCPNAF